MNIIVRIKHLIKTIYVQSSSERYKANLREQGVVIGNNVLFREPRTTRIDLSRPCLVEIGNDVDINTHFCIMTHDFANFVFRNYFLDYVNSCGKVSIGNNIYFGTNVTILKGVSIGNNCVIGAGSLVTKDIPDNSVAAGVPCKVICSIEEYYKKRKNIALEEAKEYVRCFRKVHHRNPRIEELKEEWIYFVDAHNMKNYPMIDVKHKIGGGYEKWLKEHHALFQSYEEFMNAI